MPSKPSSLNGPNLTVLCGDYAQLFKTSCLEAGEDGFQCKMSMKRGGMGLGVARPGADTDAECREPEPGTNPRVSTKQRADPVRGRGSVRALRLGGSAAGRAELWGVRQG